MSYEPNIYQNIKTNYNQLLYNKRFKKIVFAFLGVLSLSLDPSQAGHRHGHKLHKDMQEIEHRIGSKVKEKFHELHNDIQENEDRIGNVVKNAGKVVSASGTAMAILDPFFCCLDCGIASVITAGIGKGMIKIGDKIEEHASSKK